MGVSTLSSIRLYQKGYSRGIHMYWLCVGYVSGMYRVCIGTDNKRGGGRREELDKLEKLEKKQK